MICRSWDNLGMMNRRAKQWASAHSHGTGFTAYYALTQPNSRIGGSANSRLSMTTYHGAASGTMTTYHGAASGKSSHRKDKLSNKSGFAAGFKSSSSSKSAKSSKSIKLVMGHSLHARREVDSLRGRFETLRCSQ